MNCQTPQLWFSLSRFSYRQQCLKTFSYFQQDNKQYQLLRRILMDTAWPVYRSRFFSIGPSVMYLVSYKRSSKYMQTRNICKRTTNDWKRVLLRASLVWGKEQIICSCLSDKQQVSLVQEIAHAVWRWPCCWGARYQKRNHKDCCHTPSLYLDVCMQ